MLQGVECGGDGYFVVAHAQFGCHCAGIGKGYVCGVGRGHHHGLHLFAPEQILLGGSVAIHNPGLIERARVVIRQRAHAIYQGVPIELAALGDRAGILGAVALFLHMREGRA